MLLDHGFVRNLVRKNHGMPPNDGKRKKNIINCSAVHSTSLDIMYYCRSNSILEKVIQDPLRSLFVAARSPARKVASNN